MSDLLNRVDALKLEPESLLDDIAQAGGLPPHARTGYTQFECLHNFRRDGPTTTLSTAGGTSRLFPVRQLAENQIELVQVLAGQRLFPRVRSYHAVTQHFQHFGET